MGIWSEEIVGQLRSLAEQGFSASQAAANFIGMTRNAAVGLAFRRKFHFMGGKGGGPNHLAPAAKPKLEKMMSFPKRSYRKAPEVVIALSASVTEADVAPRRNVSILELAEGLCKFPLGDPLESDFGYCGSKAHPNYPYCATHCRLSYQQPEDRHVSQEPRRSGHRGFFNNAVRHGSFQRGSL